MSADPSADWAQPADWAQSCLRILEAGSESSDRVFALLAGAARRLADAAGATVVGWQATGPLPLARSGASFPLPARRLPEGLTAEPGRVIVSTTVQGEIDLLIWWAADQASPVVADQTEVLRLLAALAATASRQAGAALSSLYAVAQQLLAARDSEEFLLGLATAASRVLRAEIAGVFLTTGDGDAVQAQAVVGNRAVETARLRLSRGESLVGHVYATGQVYRADDWTTDPVTSKQLLTVASIEGTQTAIGAPMQADGKVIGVLAAWRRRRSIYTDDDVALITALADLAAVGVTRALDAQRLRDVSEQLVKANQALSERYEETRQALEMHRRLTRIVADGFDLDAVVRALHDITGQEVSFVSADGTVVGSRNWLEQLVRAPRRRELPTIGAEAVLLGPDAHRRLAIAVPVRSGGLQWGEVVVAAAQPPSARDAVAAEQAALACAALLSRRDAVADAARRLESEFVWDLLDGRIADEADVIVRSRQLARELPRAARVALLSVRTAPSWSQEPPAAPSDRVQHVRTKIIGLIVRLLDQHGLRVPVGGRGDTLAVIMPDRPVEFIRRIGYELCRIGEDVQRQFLIGISAPVHTIEHYTLAARQAAYACAATRPPDAPVVVFEDLGAVQFLLEPAYGEDLDRYASQQLGALVDYDRDHGASLVHTLGSYLRCDGNVQRAAAELCIHAKTVRYRLSRIETLTGMNLARQEDRFNAQLALKILAMWSGHMPLH